MKIIAIIQARMSSTRLPGKVLMQLAHIPVLEHVVNRLEYCKSIAEIVVATSIDQSDDLIEDWCAKAGVKLFRGSLNDVLDRYYQAATLYKADVIVRITADCPAIDPNIVDEVVQGFIAGGYDFFGLSGEFPDGLDCTVFSYGAIYRAWKEAKLPSEREHVGPYIENNPTIFKNGGLHKFTGLSHHRWTLDEPADYRFLQIVFDRLFSPLRPFSSDQILSLLEKEPELLEINSNIIRNEGYLKSLIKEEK